MKLKISRSFSKKIQLRQFEPVDFFCAAETEIEVPETDEETRMEKAEIISRQLDRFCQDEVEKSLREVKPTDTKQYTPKFENWKKDVNKLNFVDRHKSADQAAHASEMDTEQYIPEKAEGEDNAIPF